MDIAHLQIKVKAGASRNEVSSFKDGILNLRVKRTPYPGKAKDAIIILVSKFLGVPKKCLSLTDSSRKRLKILEIDNISKADLHTHLMNNPSISNSG